MRIFNSGVLWICQCKFNIHITYIKHYTYSEAQVLNHSLLCNLVAKSKEILSQLAPVYNHSSTIILNELNLNVLIVADSITNTCTIVIEKSSLCSKVDWILVGAQWYNHQPTYKLHANTCIQKLHFLNLIRPVSIQSFGYNQSGTNSIRHKWVGCQ